MQMEQNALHRSAARTAAYGKEMMPYGLYGYERDR